LLLEPKVEMMGEFELFEFVMAHSWPFIAAFAESVAWMFFELYRFVSSKG
jgi:hypothetical protein